MELATGIFESYAQALKYDVEQVRCTNKKMEDVCLLTDILEVMGDIRECKNQSDVVNLDYDSYKIPIRKSDGITLFNMLENCIKPYLTILIVEPQYTGMVADGFVFNFLLSKLGVYYILPSKDPSEEEVLEAIGTDATSLVATNQGVLDILASEDSTKDKIFNLSEFFEA